MTQAPSQKLTSENNVSKTNYTSKLGHDTLKDHGALDDTELNAVTGGNAAPKLSGAVTGTHDPGVLLTT
jgi:hypothetical protein